MRDRSHFYIVILISLTFTCQGLAQSTSPRLDTINEILYKLANESYLSSQLPGGEPYIYQLLNLDPTQNEFLYILEYLQNNGNILNESSADQGILGKLNRCTEKKRLKRFNKKISNGEVSTDKKVVLAEGDSWFTYPIFIKDIIDYLNDEDDIIIRSTSYGGDWLSNYGVDKQVTSLYEKLKPNVLLLSGGGNDMVGKSNLARYVKRDPQLKDDKSTVELALMSLNTIFRNMMKFKKVDSSELKMSEEEHGLYHVLEYAKQNQTNWLGTDSMKQKEIKNGISHVYKASLIGPHNGKTQNQFLLDARYSFTGNFYLSDEFFDFLKFAELQYLSIIQNLKRKDTTSFEDLHIILQGYDYAIPTSKTYGWDPVRHITNASFGHGEWLEFPLQMKGIHQPMIQQAILKTMIDHFYEMLHRVANVYNSDNSIKVSIIDSRDVVTNHKDWYNELHPKGKVFKRIAKAYMKAISDASETRKKVYFSKNY